MKRTLLFSLCTGLFSILSSQVYQPIPTDSVYWVELESGYDGGNCTYYNYRYIYPVGNVTIEGNVYNEFRANSVTSFSNDYPPWLACPATQYFTNNIYILIRNDSLNKKVYFYDTNYTHQVKVLYDFNMSVGDTVSPESAICACSEQCPFETFIVSNVDSLDIGGEYRKRFEIARITLGDTLYMIEGIGSDLGFAFNRYCPQEQYSNLVCYHYKNLSYSPSNFMGSSFCSTSIGIENNYTLTANDLIIPLGKNSYYLKNDENNLINITGYDMLGKLILQKSFQESGYLEFTQTPTGIYFLYMIYNGEVIRPYKFIVQQ